MAEQQMESNIMSSLAHDEERKSAIVHVGRVGIVANVALAAFKAAVGIMSNSIAIVLDAVNNLSDAASSIITIIGTTVAGKQPDRQHPLGHGRVEYLTTIIVSAVVLWAGLTSLTESIKGILHPLQPDYRPITLIVVATAVVVKIVLGQYTKRQGRLLNSDTLLASGADATMDAVISASTLAAAGIYLATGVALEAWLGAIISLIIIKSGVDMLRESISKIVGERVDPSIAHAVKESVCSVPGVMGAYDLILTDYGPQRLQGSVHISVDETLTARGIDQLTRAVQFAVARDTGIILHTIGIYSANTNADGSAANVLAALEELTDYEEYVLQYHGFYVDEEIKAVNFDLVVSFDAPDRREVFDRVVNTMKRRFPDYTFVAVMDSDISD